MAQEYAVRLASGSLRYWKVDADTMFDFRNAYNTLAIYERKIRGGRESTDDA